jgi:hypothetical protein
LPRSTHPTGVFFAGLVARLGGMLDGFRALGGWVLGFGLTRSTHPTVIFLLGWWRDWGDA